jgi:hypothetical protein
MLEHLDDIYGLSGYAIEDIKDGNPEKAKELLEEIRNVAYYWQDEEWFDPPDEY